MGSARPPTTHACECGPSSQSSSARSTLAALVGASTNASAGRACVGDVAAGGYSYAGHQATYRGHGVRATITMTRAPSVEAGHVAGWVGVGGPGQGANGEDAWIQAGIASMHGMDPMIYAEITRRRSRAPQFILVEEGVAVGRAAQARRPRDVGTPGLVACLGGRSGRDRARPPARLVRALGADRDGGELERRHSRRATRSASASSGSRSRTAAAVRGGRSCPAISFLDGANMLRDLAVGAGRSRASTTARSRATERLPYAFVAASAASGRS